MTASKAWFPYVDPDPVNIVTGLEPEVAPGIYWGQGTPDGDAEPFLSAQKGTIYHAVNNTDDESHSYIKVDEGGDDADWVRLLSDVMGLAHGLASGDDASINWDFTATMASGVYYAGLDVRVVLDGGSTGVWASAAYFKLTQDSTKRVNGYISALELELTNTANSASAQFVLVLNAGDSSTTNLNSQRAFIAINEYGSAACPALLRIGQEIVAAVGSSSNTVIFTTTGASYEENVDYALRIIAGSANTPYWIPLCSTGPGG
jgi:hypothetical protein